MKSKDSSSGGGGNGGNGGTSCSVSDSQKRDCGQVCENMHSKGFILFIKFV